MTGVGRVPADERGLPHPPRGHPRSGTARNRRRAAAGDVLHPRGGYILGSPATQLYDGAALARRGCVYVSANYRLGASAAWTCPRCPPRRHRSTATFLRDIVLALSWVKKNIAAFGGDPDNVTIFGESARAHAVATLLAVPPAEGLFHQAIRRARPPAWSARRRWPPRSPTGSSTGWVSIAATPPPNWSSQARRSGPGDPCVMTHSLDNIVGASAVGPTHGDDFRPGPVRGDETGCGT